MITRNQLGKLNMNELRVLRDLIQNEIANRAIEVNLNHPLNRAISQSEETNPSPPFVRQTQHRPKLLLLIQPKRYKISKLRRI